MLTTKMNLEGKWLYDGLLIHPSAQLRTLHPQQIQLLQCSVQRWIWFPDLKWFCTFLKKKKNIPFFVPPLYLNDYAIDSGVRRPVGKVFWRTFDSCAILVEWMLPKPLKIEITHHLVISTISKIVPVVWCGRWESGMFRGPKWRDRSQEKSCPAISMQNSKPDPMVQKWNC